MKFLRKKDGKSVADLINAWGKEENQEQLLIGIEPICETSVNEFKAQKNKFEFKNGSLLIKPRGWSPFYMRVLNDRQAKRLATLIEDLT